MSTSTVIDVTPTPAVSGWDTLSLTVGKVELHKNILSILRSTSTPWKDIDLVPRSAEESSVMNILQEELDLTDSREPHFTSCFKCMRALSNARDIYPESLIIRETITIHRDPKNGWPVVFANGGSADVYKGIMDGKQVCIKAFRTMGRPEGEKLAFLKIMCREAIAWKQLSHKNILPFIGVDTTTIPERPSLISPFMKNGNVRQYLKKHPKKDRLTMIRQIASAIGFIHGFDPQIIHGNICGNNIIVNDDGHCCLADFGASIIVGTDLPSNTHMGHNSPRWLCPELQKYDETTYLHVHLPGRDIYALGCTIIEIYTGNVPYAHVELDSTVQDVICNKELAYLRPSEISSDRLWQLVQECMTYEPELRPKAAYFKEALLADM